MRLIDIILIGCREVGVCPTYLVDDETIELSAEV
jgi:hypothetical protein